MNSSHRIFLGNLPYNITEEELSGALLIHGHPHAEVKVIRDRESGQGRGFAFAEFWSVAAAERAIAELAGVTLLGRPLRVARANERTFSGGPRNPHSNKPGPGAPDRRNRFEGRGASDSRSYEDAWREERHSKRGGR